MVGYHSNRWRSTYPDNAFFQPSKIKFLQAFPDISYGWQINTNIFNRFIFQIWLISFSFNIPWTSEPHIYGRCKIVNQNRIFPNSMQVNYLQWIYWIQKGREVKKSQKLAYVKYERPLILFVIFSIPVLSNELDFSSQNYEGETSAIANLNRYNGT